MPTTLTRRLPIIYGLLAVITLVLLWLAREQPVMFGVLRFDGLSLFFVLLALVAPLLRQDITPRTMLVTLLSVLALTSRLTPLIALAAGLAAAAAMPRLPRLHDVVQVWPMWAAIGSLAIGYGLLAARGALWFDQRSAGAALDSLAFWFVLLAAALPLWVRDDGRWTMDGGRKTGDDRQQTTNNKQRTTNHEQLTTDNGQLTTNNKQLTTLVSDSVLFLYPLVRLYSLGPWNPGWALAAALFGGALALRHAHGALVRPAPVVYSTSAMLAAMGLASFGLSSSAGIVAGCYAALASVLLANGKWQVTGTFGPIALVFVACWMAVGAATAGGVATLAAVLWAAALLVTLAITLRSGAYTAQHHGERKQTEKIRFIAFVSSWITIHNLMMATAILAPLVVMWLIEPAVAQLQGGLTPYGDVLIWPWIGIAFVNSAQGQVAVLTSVAVAVLMAVLVSLVFLLTRLRSRAGDERLDGGEQQPAANDVADYRWLWQIVREEVPWLGGKRDRDTE